MTQPSSTPLNVNYSITGNAVAGTNYTSPYAGASGVLTLASTQTSATVAVTLPAGNTAPNFTQALQFNFENGNYFSYALNPLITLTNSLDAEPPTTNLQIHYDATSIVSSSGSISQWTDLSGNSNNATQSGGSEPSLGTGASPVLPTSSTVVMNGTGDHMTIASATNINSGGPYTGKTITIAFVTGSDVTRTQILYAQGTSTYGLNIYIQSGNIYANGWQTSGTTWGPVYVSSAVQTNTYYIFTLVFSSSAGTIAAYKSGSLVGSSTGAKSLTGAGSENCLGGCIGSTLLANSTVISNISSSTCLNSQPCQYGGTMLEFYYYNTALTALQVEGHHNFLFTKETQNVASIAATGLSVTNEQSGSVPKAFKVTLRSPTASALTINYTVDSSSTAVSGTDYSALSGSVTIPAGYASAYIPVTLLDDTGAASNKTLQLDLSSSSNYAVSSTAANASITIVNENSYTPPNLLAWFNVPQSLTFSNNLVTNWADLATATCTHPINAFQTTSGQIPVFQSSNIGIIFDGMSMFNINSNTCIDNVSGGISQRSFVMVFQTGNDITTPQVLYAQGNATSGLNIVISGGYVTLTAYASGWNQYTSAPISANALIGSLFQYSSGGYLEIGFQSSAGSQSSQSSGTTGGSIPALSNNGIGIGGVSAGAKFYSQASSAYVTVPNSPTNVDFLTAGTTVYELIIMNNTIMSTGGTLLSDMQTYIQNKYPSL